MVNRSVRPAAYAEAEPLSQTGVRRVAPANEAPHLQSAIVRRLFVVAFFAPPSPQHVEALEKDLVTAHERLRPPLHYLGIIDSSSDVPSPAARQALSSLGRTVDRLCASAHLVIEGEGFRSAVQRSVVTAIHLLKGQRVHCYRSLRHAAPALGPLLDMSVVETESTLRRAIAP